MDLLVIPYALIDPPSKALSLTYGAAPPQVNTGFLRNVAVMRAEMKLQARDSSLTRRRSGLVTYPAAASYFGYQLVAAVRRVDQIKGSLLR